VFSGATNLRAELQVLFYLAVLTNRSLIIPNLLGSEKLKAIKHYNDLALWPGFRVAKVTPNEVFDVEVLEPGYYFRVERDYLQSHQRLPDPHVVSLTTTKTKESEITLRKIIQKLLLPATIKQPRVVLDLTFGIQHESDDIHEVVSRDDLRARMWLRTRVQQWARDSVGDFHSYAKEKEKYIPLPYFSESDKTFLETDPLQVAIRKNVRTCASVFMEQRGNRSCFDKCK